MKNSNSHDNETEGLKYSSDNRVIISISVLMATVAMVTVMTNLTVLVAMMQTLVKDRQRSLKTVAIVGGNSYITRHLVLSMTFSGVLVGCFIMPMSILDFYSNGHWSYGYSLCAIKVYTDYMLCAVSTLHVLYMALDTFVLICKPLFYRQLTVRAAYVMIASGWAFPMLMIVLWSSLQDELLEDCVLAQRICNQSNYSSIFNNTFGAIFYALFFVVVVLYVLIMRKVIAHKNRNLNSSHTNSTSFSNMPNADHTSILNVNHSSNINMNELSTITSITMTFNAPIFQRRNSDYTAKADIKKQTDLKCFRFIGVIMTWFSVCWLPSWIVFMLCTSCTMCLPDWAVLVFDWLTYISCTFNPVIYCRNKSIGSSVKSLLYRLTKFK